MPTKNAPGGQFREKAAPNEFAGILHGAGGNEQKKLNWVVNKRESRKNYFANTRLALDRSMCGIRSCGGIFAIKPAREKSKPAPLNCKGAAPYGA